MVDISSGDKKINITVSTSGNKASVNATPDTAMYYSNKSREWAISDKIVSNEDYSSKYYANVSKQNADKSTATFENLTTNYNEYKTDLENTKNISVEEIETAKTNAISDITNQETLSVDNVNTAGETQVNLAKEQATIATNKAEEANEIVDNAVSNIVAKSSEQIALIQNEGATQIANVKSTGFYMKDDKLYFINSKGEEKEFKSGGGLEIGDIGIAPLGIDETKGKRRYLNGQLIIQEQYVQFTNKVKNAITLYPSLACTEEEWQTTATMTVGGQVGKFVVDDEAGTIRLPKIIMPIRGLTDLSKLGEIVEAGLPNITGHANTILNRSTEVSASGALSVTSTTAQNIGSTGSPLSCSYFNTRLDASKSNPIYGKSGTVQPEAIQYPYFIQVATGAETEDNIINEIELNNPFSLFDSKYSDHELNNLSWLKSEGQWNAKAVYPTAYDKLLKVYNGTETKNGVSVKLTTETFTDYDFVLNTSEETFRLPLLDGSEDLPSDKLISLDFGAVAVGNYTYTAPCNGIFITRFTGNDTTTVVLFVNGNAVDKTKTTASQQGTVQFPVKRGDNITFSVQTVALKSIEGQGIVKAQGNGSLYYYVGETVQNANLINAGRIQETYTTKSMIDGQWVNYSKQILTYTSLMGTTNIRVDLSNILPNDGYRYECIFDMYVISDGTSGAIPQGALMSDEGIHLGCCQTTATTATKIYTVGSCVLPIGLGRYVEVYRFSNSSGKGTSNLDLIAYRRLGTNL